VPAIPASSIYTIYMYYGNPNATSTADPNQVFDLFDDFSGTALNTNKWTLGRWTGSGSYSANVANGYVEIYAGSTTAAGIVSKTGFILPFIEELSWYKVADKETWITITNVAGGSDTDWLRHGYITTTYYYQKRTSGTITTYQSFSRTPPSSFTTSKVIWKYGNCRYYESGVQVNTTTTQDRYTDGTTVYVQLFCYDGGTMRVDWVRVRKYADPEPTTTVDPEEVAPAVAVFTPIDEFKKRLIFTTTPSFLSLSGSGSINILSPSGSTKTLTVRNWWLITNATGGKITLASPSKLFGSLLAKKQKKTGQEDIWTTLGMGEPILLYYQGITPDSKVLVLLSWRED